MANGDDLRRHALALPEVVERAHRGRPSFAVRGAGFAVLRGTGRGALLSVSAAEAAILTIEEPDTFATATRDDGTYVGMRVALSRLDVGRVPTLVAHAWRHQAPHDLLLAHPEVGDDLPQLGEPAERALARAGITHLGQLTRMPERDLATLPGIGPGARRRLRHALAASGRSFANS